MRAVATSKEAGEYFELQVGEALELAGFRVTSEQLVGHAKVDLLARETRFGGEHTIAVECKNEAKRLSRRRVVAIWTDWEPLIDRGLVDEVLIVAANGLAPSAMAYVEGKRGLAAQRLEDLLASSIRFGSYLSALREEYTHSSDGLRHYYIPPTDVDGRDLEDVIRRWLAGDTASGPSPNQPIAVLGAYGLGKSSFATHLAARLAEEAEADVTARVPVLVRLHELIGEQSLEGLLGKHFTATHDAPGYSFAKLMKLNRAGRLVVFFDGFDEMRQMLTWREFRHNLRELNRMCVGDARVVILGRPTAFETDAQQRLGLHGEQGDRDGRLRRDPDWPDYHELELATLTEDQCKTFLRRYLAYRQGGDEIDDEGFDSLWYSVNSQALRDISRRPVQLRMLAEILPSYSGDTDQLDIVTLYDLFVDELIDRVIGREEEKQSRLAFSSEDRRLFLRRFAYWLWTSQPTDQVTTDQLPDELVEPFAPTGDLEAARRDLVVGSPLDRRAGGRIRFPHRSFQEFLVAEELWARLGAQSGADPGASPRERAITMVTEADQVVSREVADFMSMLRSGRDEAVSRKLLVAFEGQMSMRLIEALFMTSSGTEEIRKRLAGKAGPGAIRPWELLVLTLWNRREGGSGDATHVALRKFSTARHDPADQLLALFCFLLSGESGSAAVKTALGILGRILAGGQQVERIRPRSFAPRNHRQGSRLEAKDAYGASGKQTQRRFVANKPQSRPEREQTGGSIESRRLKPVGQDLVLGGGAGGMRNARLGMCLSRTRLVDIGDGRFRLSGGPELQVRWLPDWGAELLGRIEFRDDGRSLHFDRLHPLFARVLAPIAFTTEWTETIRLGRRLDIADRVEVSVTRPEWMSDAVAANREIRRRWRTFDDSLDADDEEAPAPATRS